VEEFDIPVVKTAISRLREAEVPLFGADKHGFHLNPPLSEAEATAFERDHSVLLPPDYRQFITRIGNGGAGPFYGIFPLGSMDHNFNLRPWKENDGFVGTLSKPFPFKHEWNDLCVMPQDDLLKRDADEYDRRIEQFDRTYWSSDLVNGAIPICHEGCALRMWLVLSGEQAGNVWEDRRSEYKGLRPVRIDNGSSATFYEWYAEWLDNCFAKAGYGKWR
jgi:hypothetical protein